MKEARIGHGHAVSVGEGHRPVGQEGGDGEGHGQAVVAPGIDGGAVEWPASLNDHPVFGGFCLGAHGPESLGDQGDPVGFRPGSQFFLLRLPLRRPEQGSHRSEPVSGCR